MANIQSPQGFIPVTPGARLNGYTIASLYNTTINYGDPVKLTGTGIGALPSIQVAVGGDTAVGIFGGANIYDGNGRPAFIQSWTASMSASNVVALVYDDPNTEFMIQCNGAFSVNDYGNKVDFLAGTGTNGISGYVLPSTNIGTGDNLRIRRLFDAPNNSVGDYAQVIVAFAEHTYLYPFTAV